MKCTRNMGVIIVGPLGYSFAEWRKGCSISLWSFDLALGVTHFNSATDRLSIRQLHFFWISKYTLLTFSPGSLRKCTFVYVKRGEGGSKDHTRSRRHKMNHWFTTESQKRNLKALITK
jgi:hypothetical protein